MKKSALFVFDQTCSVEKLLRYCRKKNTGNIFLCPITTDQNIISSAVKDLSSSINCEIKLVPYLDRFNMLSFLERDNFIRFITRFTNDMNFKEYFREFNSSFSIWWTSLIAEKNPLKSNSYHNLIKLLAVLELKKEYDCEEIILDIKSEELSCALKANAAKNGYICKDIKKHRKKSLFFSFLVNILIGLKYYCCIIFKRVLAAIATKGLNFRKEILKKAEYLAITYFPLVDKKSLKEERFVDEYYGSLQAALESKYKDKFIWLAITSSNFWNNLMVGKREMNTWNYPIYFMEEWLSIKDFFIVIVQYIHIVTKCIMKTQYVSKRFEYPSNKVNIWSIFDKDWFSSFAGFILMGAIIYRRIFINISNKLKDKVIVLYLAENHAWEKVLNFTFHNRKKSRVIGVLHTSVPLLLLQLFNSKNELEKDDQKELTMLKPDYLACSGKIPLELLETRGYSREKPFLWFAVRYTHLKEHLENRISWNTRQNKILVALTIHAEESKEILRYIHQAFGNHPGYQIIIKGHRLRPIRFLIRELRMDFSEDTFIISEERLDKTLPSVKAMIVGGSSAALESIALDCPVIIPRLSSVIDMNPLSGISDLPIYVRSPEELRAVVDDIIMRKDSPLPYDKCKNFIKNYFNFSNSTDELLEKIESRIKI